MNVIIDMFGFPEGKTKHINNVPQFPEGNLENRKLWGAVP